MNSPPFGALLRDWRHTRGLSQLDLAIQADVSQRHISFIESGRSRPSTAMVVRISQVLDVPPREQNILLTAAGHAPAFTETPLEQLDQIADVLDFMLNAHEPHVAFVVDRRWNIVRANNAAMAFMSRMFPESPAEPGQHMNVMRLSFRRDGLRAHMLTWAVTATALLRRLERDAASFPNDTGLQDLLEEVRGYPDVGSLPRGLPGAPAGDLLVPITYVIDGEQISLFTTIAVIGDAHDLTLAELRLETFWPTDRDSARRWTSFVAAQRSAGGNNHR